MINKSMLLAMTCGLSLAFMSCENQKFNDTYADAERVHLDTLSAEMQKVRDYVPELAVVAHRGSTYWAPEETESAYRWARETGADYLEADLQVSKDGVILALHDTDLKRTTNIEDVFGERFPEAERYYYYRHLLNYSEEDTQTRIAADKEAFVPNYPCSYTYYELLMLDAGTWFNEDEASLEQARTGFTTHYQYISTLEDLIMFSKGYRLQRYGEAGAPAAGDIDFWTKYGSRDGSTPSAAGHRVVVSLTPHPDETFSNPVNYRYDGTALTETVVTYDFEYVKDGSIFSHKVADFTIHPGDHIAVTGKSGEGKTTFLNLFTNQFHVMGGSISVDNIDYKDLPAAFFDEHITYISQDVELFDMTLYDNIVMGKRVAPEKLQKIIDGCCLNELIERMNGNIHTDIGEKGVKVSAGEKQRISLARGLLLDRDILVLDEITANLDPITTQNIWNFIFTAYGDKTIIAVSHEKDLLNHITRRLEFKKGVGKEVNS